MPDKPSAVVTTHHRYKRPRRKRKAAALDVPAVVRRTKPGNGNLPDPESAQRPAIVTTTSRKRTKLLRTALWVEQDDDPEVVAQINAFFARMMRPPDG